MNEKYEKLKDLFCENADCQSATKMSNYMQNKFEFYGIKAPIRKQLYKRIICLDKKSKVVDWDFLYACYNDNHREMHYFAVDYLVDLSKFLNYCDIQKMQVFFKTNQWWDTIDLLDKVMSCIGLKDNRVDDLMIEWSKSNDIWLRRVAIDYQLDRKEKTNKDILQQIILNNLGCNEFFINKAIGWSLREYAKTNPTWVSDFVKTYKDKLSSLSVREISKYL